MSERGYATCCGDDSLCQALQCDALVIRPQAIETAEFLAISRAGLAATALNLIDEKEAMTAPFVVCLPKNGCMADYKADTDHLSRKGGGTPAMSGDQ